MKREGRTTFYDLTDEVLSISALAMIDGSELSWGAKASDHRGSASGI